MSIERGWWSPNGYIYMCVSGRAQSSSVSDCFDPHQSSSIIVNNHQQSSSCAVMCRHVSSCVVMCRHVSPCICIFPDVHHMECSKLSSSFGEFQSASGRDGRRAGQGCTVTNFCDYRIEKREHVIQVTQIWIEYNPQIWFFTWFCTWLISLKILFLNHGLKNHGLNSCFTI